VQGTFAPTYSSKPHLNNGAIYLYAYANSQDNITPLTFTNFSNAADFHPLGLAFDSKTSQLYVINHSRHSGSVIEIFHVSHENATAKHISTFSHPLLHAPNAIELMGDAKMYVTNDHRMRAAVSPLLSKIETFAGIPGGSVVYIDINRPDEAKIVARVAFANGIVRFNHSSLVVASSSKPGLYFYEVGENGVDLGFKEFVRTPAGADNLSLDSEGKLLIAGHPFALALVDVAKRRAECDEEGTEEQKKSCGCWAPSWVGEWSEKDGLKTLLMDGGEEVCSSSTAVRDTKRGLGLVSMLYGRGIVVFRE
jgi:arylesterase/paraoxonase